MDEEGLGGETRHLPRVVEEAHEVLASYYTQLAVGGVAGAAGWLAVTLYVVPLPLAWLFTILALTAFLAVKPVTREPRLAQDVLARWDRLRVDRALASSGVVSDPRLEVAESMADRILRHPSSHERTRTATTALLRRLERLLDDLRRTSYLTSAAAVDEREEANRSVSDLHDLLDARVADVLAHIARLHRTVVLRDTAAIADVVEDTEELLLELEAETEVERLLTSAENQ